MEWSLTTLRTRWSYKLYIDLWIDLLRMPDVCKNLIPDIFPDVCTEAYINLWAIGYVSLHIVSRGGLENFSRHAVFSDALALWSFIGIRS